MRKATISKRTYLGLAASLVILGLFLFIANLHKEITITLDGKQNRISTWALTVNQVIAETGISISGEDQINPALNHWIWRGDTIIIDRAATIQIDIDGKIISFNAVNPIPEEIILGAGIDLNPGDKLYDGLKEIPLNESFHSRNQILTWQLHRAVPFTIREGVGAPSFTSSATTIGQALWENGIHLKAGDETNLSLDTPLDAGVEFTLRRAKPMQIMTAQATIHMFSAAPTISEALNKAGLSLQGLDYTIPNENEPVPADQIIQLIRVNEEIHIDQTPISFETSYQAVSDLEIDRQMVVEEGSYGLEAQRIRIRYEDGKEVSRQVEETWTAQQPQNRIIGFGTQLVMRTIDTPDGAVDYWRALQVYAVSYNPSSAGGTITSTGQQLKKGIIAVNPQYIPYGTVLYVPGYGFGVAADTGRLPPRWIDLGYSDDDYVSWHQNVTVYFVWPPPQNIVWIIP